MQGIFVAQTYGAKGDGATDDYAAITAAIAAAYAAGGGIVWLPPTGAAYLIKTGLNLLAGVKLLGAGTACLNGSGTTIVSSWAQTGTWINCTDTVNPAVTIGTATTPAHGASVVGINFVYSQPAQTSGWTPTLYPWTLLIQSDLVVVENVWIIGAAYGVNLNNPNTYGIGNGIRLRDVRIDAYVRGLRTAGCNDNVVIDGLFVEAQSGGLQNQYVTTYILNNLICWECGYTDNPQVSNCYFFLGWQGILFVNETVLGNTHSFFNGTVNNLQIGLCRIAMSCSSGVVVTGQFSNVTAQGTALAVHALTGNSYSDILFNLQSDAIDIQFNGLAIPSTGGQVAIFGAGVGGQVEISNLNVGGYSQVLAAQACLARNAGCNLIIDGRSITKPSGAGNTLVTVGSTEIASPYNETWAVYSMPGQATGVCTGSNINISSFNGMFPRDIGKLQCRISGDVNITSAVSLGTIAFSLVGFPEITVTAPAGATGNQNFDSGWLDFTTAARTKIQYVTSIGTLGIAWSMNYMDVMFR